MIYQDVLEALFRASRYRTYLELGIGDGSTFRRIAPHAEFAVAVDLDQKALDTIAGTRAIGAVTAIRGTTTDFFARAGKKGPFDMVFVDADHKFESVRDDLDAALEVLSDDGVVALHDTDPSEPRYLSPGHCNDAHRIHDHLAMRELCYVTLPVGHEGLTLVRWEGAASRRVGRFSK